METLRVRQHPEPVFQERKTMSAYDTSAEEGTATQTTLDARPDGCTCLSTFEDLPCFPCFRAGFDEPNPNADD